MQLLFQSLNEAQGVQDQDENTKSLPDVPHKPF